VRDNELILPDSQRGLRRIDLQTGKDIEVVAVESAGFSEPAPMYLAAGPGGLAVSGVRHRWHRLDSSLDSLGSHLHAMADPLGSCIAFNDRFIVYGFAREEKTRTGHAWLFVHREGESPLPLAEYAPTEDPLQLLGEFHVRQITQGGVCRIEAGGWVAVDPLSYSIRVFDQYDRLVKAFHGSSSAFRRPDVDGYPHGRWDPTDRSAYFAWLEAQCQVKRPVDLGNGMIGVVLSIPDRGGHRLMLDVYRLDGTKVAVAVPIPRVKAPRVIVADAEAGRLVLLSQRQSWPFAAQVSVWEVEVEGLPVQ
jgi:hypothetical protein